MVKDNTKNSIVELEKELAELIRLLKSEEVTSEFNLDDFRNMKRVDDLESRIKNLEEKCKKYDEEKENSIKCYKDKVWDIIKIVLSAVIGSIITLAVLGWKGLK